jgi:WD40 repeat protein/DNA-binding SARP family transcriptional activator/energy-coupling factor transporter ATP-binding protein EcfA2
VDRLPVSRDRRRGINLLSVPLTTVAVPLTFGSMGIAVLGPLTAGANGALSPRDRVVLSALVVRIGTATSAEELADALWGDQPPASWNKVVPGCVNRLRKVIGASAISTSPNGYRLELPDDEVDARRFERLVAKGHQMLALGEPDRAILAFREALALWRGPALRDVEEWPPARVEVERLEELRLETEEAVIDASLRVGLQAGILAEARARVAQAPVRERRWALLALAQYLSGAQADALATLRRARELLTRELGLDPGAELVQLEQAVLRQDPALTVATALPRPVARCPYPGLLPYEVEDTDFFFGRSADLAACRRRLEESGALVLVGPSGSGKSSLLRAGLAASLAEDGVECVIVATGATDDELLAEIEAGNDRSVLVLDQVEEIVARFGSPPHRARFADALVAFATHRRVALAIRADRFGDLADLPGFPDLAERGLVLLGPLDEGSLREAIEGPAREAALLLEPGLVDVLLQDVRDDPGALPLLSHALRETWERREGRTLTVEGYRASGGIRGAVARSAEQVYDDLPDEDRDRLRALMLRLLTLAPDGEPLRSAVPRGAIPADAAHELLVERLVRARLVTADADVLDLAHETLARAWPRLRGWLDDDLEGQRILRHLSTAAESWHAMGRPDAELYREDRLGRATAWQAASGADLTAHEADFLARSREVAEAAAAEVDRAAAAQRRRHRRAVGMVATATTLALVAGLAGWVAVRERGHAAQERNQAAAERLVGSARRAASSSQAADDVARSLLLAVEAVRRDDSPDTHAALLAALGRSPALVRVIPGGGLLRTTADGTGLFIWGDEVQRVDTTTFETVGGDEAFADLLAEPGRTVFPNEGRVAIETPRGRVHTVRAPGVSGGDLWQATSDRAVRRIAAAFDRESRGAEQFESAVVVWDAHRPAASVVRVNIAGTGDHGGVDDFVLDPGGDRLYVAGRDAHAWLRAYDTDTGELLASVPTTQTQATLTEGSRALQAGDRTRSLLRISNDGRTLATNSGTDVVLVEPRTMSIATRLRGHTHRVIAAEFSSDGSLVAASALDGSVLVWDRETGAIVERLEGIRVPVEALAFSPDSKTLYGSTIDSVLVWDLAGRRRFVSTLNEPVGPLGYLVVAAPDGRSASYFRLAATTLGTGTGFDIVTPRGRHESVNAGYRNWGAYSPSGDLLVTVEDGRLQVWDPGSGHLLREAKVPGIVHAATATVTADGSWIVVGDQDGTIRAVDADTLSAVGERVELNLPLNELVATGEGTAVVGTIVSDDLAMPAYVQVDPDTGDTKESRLPGESRVGYAAVSPDGRRLAVALAGGRVGLVDLRGGGWIHGPTTAHDTTTRVDFSSDGTRLVTSGLEGRVVLWDGLTGERLAAVQPLGPEFETGVAFLPDGHTVSIAASNGQMFRWDTDPAAWVSYACQLSGRNLTPDEWHEVFGSEPYRKTCEELPPGEQP